MNNLHRKSFYFMRHAQTDWNCEKRIIGQSDQKINTCGQKQACQAQTSVCKLPVKKIWYSPLQRCVETMHIACECLNVEKISFDPLKEWNRGVLEGKIIEGSIFTEELNNISTGGETKSEFFDRVFKGINYILTHEELSLLISHEGVYYALCNFMDIAYKDIKNCEIIFFIPILESQWQIENIT